MLLEHQIAVRYKVPMVRDHFLICDKIMTPEAFANLQKRAQEGQCVIIEAWTIGNNGKCISN